MEQQAPGRRTDPAALRQEELVHAVEQRERILDAILGSLESFVTIDRDLRVTFANSAAARLARVDAVEMRGRDVREFLSPGLREQIEDALRRAAGEQADAEFHLTTQTGTSYFGTVHPLAEGGLAVYVRDVTEAGRREAELRASEEALRASEKRYRSIVEATGDGLLIGDLEGVITFANRRMADMLGYSLDELIGMHGFDVIFPDWQPAVLDNRAALEEGEVVRGEFKLRRKDGSPIWTVFSSTPMVDAAGEHIGNITMHSDITALKEAQHALRERELLAAAQEERSRLARDLHDSVTQALFAASLKAEALRAEGDLPPEIAGVVEEVRRLTGGALAQMRAMLLELRGEPLERIPIRQLLANVVEATESRTRTRVDLTVEGDEVLPPDVHAALYRIAQEALNNVARHARAEHARVELLVRPELVRLRVADDGRGFEQRPLGPAHLGVRSMRERAAEIDAELLIASAPGEGTEVVVEWRPPSS